MWSLPSCKVCCGKLRYKTCSLLSLCCFPGLDYWNLYSWLAFLQLLLPLEIVHTSRTLSWNIWIASYSRNSNGSQQLNDPASDFFLSWNHRMFWVGRDFERSSSPNPCSEQGHLQLDQVAQSPVQPGLECFQVWGLHSLSGQPAPVFHHPYGKEFLPYI